MDDIPIFSGQKKELDSWVTCGQFISAFENFAHYNNFTEEEIKDFCLSKLSESARELFLKNSDKSWNELKILMFEKFPVKLTIREKVDIRKGLQQLDTESIDDFYRRCLQAQYFVSDDDVRDSGFEREVLLHFLIGLSPFIRDLVLAAKCSSTVEYINEAKKYVQVIKEEVVVPDVNVKIEKVDPYYEDFDYKSQYDAYGNYFTSEFVYEEVDNEDTKQKKQKKTKFPKSEMVDDLERRTCKECNKIYTSFKLMKFHMKNMHPDCPLPDHPGKQPSTCKQCNKTFKSEQYLNMHIARKHSTVDENIKCTECEKTFKEKYLFLTHMSKMHTGTENTWRCSLCDVAMTIKVKEQHQKKKHIQCNVCHLSYVHRYKHFKRLHSKSNACLYCEFIGLDENALQLHLSENHQQDRWKKCDICSENFDSRDLLLEHMEKVHSNLKQTCEFCKEVCLSIKDLAMHIASKHCTRTAEKGFLCLYCNSTTKKRASNMGYHIMNKHFNQPFYKCDECNMGFDGKEFRDSHMRYHHVSEKLFQCEVCAKDFKTLQLLKKHIKVVHEKHEKAFCKICHQTYKNEDSLRNHLRSAHVAPEERQKFMCDDCGKSFLSKQIFLDHSLTHLSDKELEKYKMPCPYPGCDYIAVRKANLKKHTERIHEKRKDHQCTICFAAFYSKYRLAEHTNGVHLNLKPFQCDLCGFTTAYKSTLGEHKRVSHGTQGKWRQGSSTPKNVSIPSSSVYI